MGFCVFCRQALNPICTEDRSALGQGLRIHEPVISRRIRVGRGACMFNLLPKDEKFYDELEQLSSLVVESAKNLEVIVEQFPRLDGQLDAIERNRVTAGK